jgi:hypothetical protein
LDTETAERLAFIVANRDETASRGFALSMERKTFRRLDPANAFHRAGTPPYRAPRCRKETHALRERLIDQENES